MLVYQAFQNCIQRFATHKALNKRSKFKVQRSKFKGQSSKVKQSSKVNNFWFEQNKYVPVN